MLQISSFSLSDGKVSQLWLKTKRLHGRLRLSIMGGGVLTEVDCCNEWLKLLTTRPVRMSFIHFQSMNNCLKILSKNHNKGKKLTIKVEKMVPETWKKSKISMSSTSNWICFKILRTKTKIVCEQLNLPIKSYKWTQTFVPCPSSVRPSLAFLLVLQAQVENHLLVTAGM